MLKIRTNINIEPSVCINKEGKIESDDICLYSLEEPYIFAALGEEVKAEDVETGTWVLTGFPIHSVDDPGRKDLQRTYEITEVEVVED